MTKYSIQEYYCSLNFMNEQHNVKYIKQELPDLKKKKKPLEKRIYLKILLYFQNLRKWVNQKNNNITIE